MKTVMLDCNQTSLAGEIIAKGGLVAIPTETVYGLAANALNETAVKKIFEAKGRPQDNPLIVHVLNINQAIELTSDFPKTAEILMNKFCPGPLTLVLSKNDKIPDCVSAGLNTVAIRIPSHKIARNILLSCNCPVAAPSANSSGKPSPTKAEHVFDDLNGKIEAIVDGGLCEFGVESTVVDVTGEIPVLLRPGHITVEQINHALNIEILIDKSIFQTLQNGASVRSPGMKYRHYAPHAPLSIINGKLENAVDFINGQFGKIGILCFAEEKEFFENIKHKDIIVVQYGNKQDVAAQQCLLFDALRELDKCNCDLIFARADNTSLAVFNRLGKAAGFNAINVD